MKRLPGHEVRRNPDGSVDEVLSEGADAFTHLEQMNDGHWWLGLTVDGETLHVHLVSERPIVCTVDWPPAA